MANRLSRASRRAPGTLGLSLILLFASLPAHAEEVTVTVLHTTDLHGHLLPTDDFTEEPAARGLARVATLVRRARAADAAALLLDAGDCIQGAPLENVAHTQMADRPDPMMLAMNAIGYDAMAVGNHEYDFGWKTLAAARTAARFPWLSANTLRGTAPAFDPYKVFTVRGVRIGVLGLTTPGVPSWSDSAKFPGLRFADAVETARKWVPVLRGKERCDAVIVLTHQGLERDLRTNREPPDQLPGENAAYALAQVPGVDVVIMGHTHRVVPSATVQGTLLTQDGSWAENLGKVELRLARDRAGAPWKLTDKRGDILPVTLDTPPDSALMALAEPYRQATRAWLDQPLGTATAAFDPAGQPLRDIAILDLLHATQLAAGRADVSLAAVYNARARIPKGTVRMRDIASVYRYENNLYTLSLTGKQVKDALEWSARYFNTYDFGRTDRPIINASIAGFNFDTAAGLDYIIDITRPVGERIRNLRYGGRPLADDRVLKVAVTSYRVNGGGGYSMLKGAKVIERADVDTRELLARYVKEAGTIRPRTDDNWQVVPAWVADPARPSFERLTRRGVWGEEEAKRIDPRAPLTRLRFAAWLGRAYGTPGAGKTRFADVPPEFSADVAAAERAGAFAGVKGVLLRATEPIDLLTAIEWTAQADHRGALPRGRDPLATAAGATDPDILRGPAGPRPPASLLRLAQAPPRFARARLSPEVERYALRRGFLDEGSPADPLALTNADGARLLAAARYPWVTVLETTDFHGHFEASPPDRQTGKRLGSSPALAAFIAQERKRNPYGTLLLDGGDLFQGTMQSNLSFGRPVIAQMNRLAYDASSVGNHEFDWSEDTLVARVHEARFPFLSANLFLKGTTKQPAWVKPAGLFERHGVTVGVVGFSTVETPTVTLPANVAHLEFPKEAPIFNRLEPRLRQRGAGVVVLMGHLPASQDSTGLVRGELARLGDEAHGEDVLLGGHSHNTVNGEVDGIPVMIPFWAGRALGRVDFVVDRVKNRVVERTARVLEVDAGALPPDSAMVVFSDSLLAALRPDAERVLCDAAEDLTRNRRGESRVGNWVADVMRARAGADIAFQNPGGLRSDIQAGPVTVQDVYEVMPFDNRIALVRLTGSQVLDAVETGVGGDGAVQVSGIRYVVDRSRPRHERVVKLTLANGTPIDTAATYLVATNDFMAQGGDGFDVFAKGKDLRVTDDMVREALIADCEKRGKTGGKLDVPLDGRSQDVSPAGATATPTNSKP